MAANSRDGVHLANAEDQVALSVHRVARVHRKIEDVVLFTWDQLRAAGMTKHLRSFDGAYAARHMRNNIKMPLSNHARGTAIDFNASTNRMGIPHDQMQMSREFAQFMEERGWSWGGRWAVSDGMHFEWVDQDPQCVPKHQDMYVLNAPKTASGSPQAYQSVPIEADSLYLNGLDVGEITKATLINRKLFVNYEGKEKL